MRSVEKEKNCPEKYLSALSTINLKHFPIFPFSISNFSFSIPVLVTSMRSVENKVCVIWSMPWTDHDLPVNVHICLNSVLGHAMSQAFWRHMRTRL